MRRRTNPAMLALAAVALAGLAGGCAGKGKAGEADSEAATAAVVSVRVARLKEIAIPSVVSAQGTWRSSIEVVANAPFAAIVESFTPRVGDHVRKGETIAQLVTRESHAALRGAALMERQSTNSASQDEARRAVAQAQHDLVRVPFVAMASGIVVRRAVDPGAEVAEGAELCALVPEGGLVFEAHTPLSEVGRVAVGMPASITMEGGVVRRAVVQRRLPNTSAADQSALVWLSPVGKEPVGALDQFGSAVIEVGAQRHATAVPDSALVEDDLTGETRVARVDPGGIALWTAVRLGAAVTGWHELLEPRLPAGTRVIILGQHGLPDSTHVRPQP